MGIGWLQRDRVCLLIGISAFFWMPQAAQASEQRACLVLDAAAVEEVNEGYLAALQIESRKLGLAWRWESMDQESDCGSGEPVLAFSDSSTVTLTMLDGEAHQYKLETTDYSASARSLARSVHEHLPSDAVGSSVQPLLAAGDTITLGEATTVSPTSPTKRLGWMVRAGGNYSRQLEALTLGGATLEAGLSMGQDRLLVSLAGSMGWTELLEKGEEAVRLTGGEALARARGGLRLGPLQLRGGVGLGWQSQKMLSEQKDDEFPEDEDRDDRDDEDERKLLVTEISKLNAGVLALEVELAWRVGERWELGVLAGPRFYFANQIESEVFEKDERLLRSAFTGQLMVGFRR